ncbi:MULTISPECIES: hypothetical protein [Roseobacteraceae]|nr:MULTISPECIES: hypothetical protein [Roseobacteraceae]
MLKTILLGSCVFVQGKFVRMLPDGRMSVTVDGRIYSGAPVNAAA